MGREGTGLDVGQRGGCAKRYLIHPMRFALYTERYTSRYKHPCIHTTIHTFTSTYILPYILTPIDTYTHRYLHPYILTPIHSLICPTYLHPYVHSPGYTFTHTYIHPHIQTPMHLNTNTIHRLTNKDKRCSIYKVEHWLYQSFLLLKSCIFDVSRC